MAMLALATSAVAANFPVFSENARILFQGDSITDGNRGRNDDPNHILGHGYCFIIAAKFGSRFPECGLTLLNRGIHGNTVESLAARWQQDTLDLKPDVLSILVGINDQGVALVKFQHVFAEACKRAPAQYWVWDAIHPTYSGHQLMADEWVKTVGAFFR
jgi:lysophospholipase L1-like esterase